MAEADASSQPQETQPSDLPTFELGYSRTPLRRKLVDAVLRGDKIATAGLALNHAPHTSDPLPKVGDKWRLLDYDDKAVAIVETTGVRIVPCGEVDLQFARDEGEGFESVEEWRIAHERFFGQPIGPDTAIVAVRFRVVERL